jgi:hypothetical protein
VTDPFRYHDGAYVLGALDDLDRRAFETHLQTCAECRARVAAARPAVGLLAGLSLSDVAEPEPMPDTLLPGLLRAARRERLRGRGLVAGLTAVAAACAASLVVVLWPSSGSSLPAAQQFTKVGASPVSASARLVSRAWGTEIDLHCKYAKQLDPYLPYEMYVVDKANHRVSVGSWRLAPGGETDFVSGTSVPRDQISRVEISLGDGAKPLLVLQA